MRPAEEDHSQLESRLNSEEQDLEQEEDHFYRHYNVSVGPVPDSKLDETMSPLLKSYQPPESGFENLSLEHELVREYHQKVAEAESLKEELEERICTSQCGCHVRISRQVAEFLVDYPEI